MIGLHKSAASTVLVNYYLLAEPIACLRVYHLVKSDWHLNIRWVDSVARCELIPYIIDVQLVFFIIVFDFRCLIHSLRSCRNQGRRFKNGYIIFDRIFLPRLQRTSLQRIRYLIERARLVYYSIIKVQ